MCPHTNHASSATWQYKTNFQHAHLCSTFLWCSTSLCIVISGPLNTLGSFMSFQMYRCLVLPRYLSGVNWVAHQARTSGLVTSR